MMQGWSRQVGCWSPRGPSAIDRRARPSGTRIQAGLLKSPSIKGAPTANLVLRLAFRSRSSPVNDAGEHLRKSRASLYVLMQNDGGKRSRIVFRKFNEC